MLKRRAQVRRGLCPPAAGRPWPELSPISAPSPAPRPISVRPASARCRPGPRRGRAWPARR